MKDRYKSIKMAKLLEILKDHMAEDSLLQFIDWEDGSAYERRLQDVPLGDLINPHICEILQDCVAEEKGRYIIDISYNHREGILRRGQMNRLILYRKTPCLEGAEAPEKEI